MRHPVDIFSRVIQRFGGPMCRMYAARSTNDNAPDAILRFMCRLQFWALHRFWPDFTNPKRFSEKLWHRLLYERDPVLSLVTDKLKVRKFVSDRVGNEILIPLLWSGTDPTEIPFDDLPQKFVIKTNHGAGYNMIVRNKEELDRRHSISQLKKWIKENYCKDRYFGIEWGYKNIDPVVLIEAYLEENGRSLTDYKFWCFSGQVEVVTLHFDRFENPKVATVNRDFEPHQYCFPLDDGNTKYRKPENHKGMVITAETLASEFGFIRVDLYNIAGRVYFGELTPYPGGAGIMFLSGKSDLELGQKWNIG